MKAAGRLIVGTVAVDIYKRIEEHVAKANAAYGAKASSGTTEARIAPKEQNANNGDKPIPLAAPDPWDGLRVGSHVVAKYWLPSGDADGWWIAQVTAINGKDFTLRWLDEPETPPLKAERKHVAVLHPSFDVKREWDRKR